MSGECRVGASSASGACRGVSGVQMASIGGVSRVSGVSGSRGCRGVSGRGVSRRFAARYPPRAVSVLCGGGDDGSAAPLAKTPTNPCPPYPPWKMMIEDKSGVDSICALACTRPPYISMVPTRPALLSSTFTSSAMCAWSAASVFRTRPGHPSRRPQTCASWPANYTIGRRSRFVLRLMGPASALHSSMIRSNFLEMGAEYVRSRYLCRLSVLGWITGGVVLSSARRVVQCAAVRMYVCMYVCINALTRQHPERRVPPHSARTSDGRKGRQQAQE